MSISKQIAAIVTQMFLCAVCLAQRERIDSLKKILPSLHDSARVDCLNELASIYLNRQTDSADFYANDAYTSAVRLNYTKGIANALINSGITECGKGNFTIAERSLRKAIPLLDTSNTAALAWAHVSIGYALYAQSNFNEAVNFYEKATTYFRKSNDWEGVSRTIALIGEVYRESGDYETSFEYAKKSLETEKEINNYTGVQYALWKMGDLYKAIADYETALNYYRESLQYQANNPLEQWKFNVEVGEIFCQMHQYDSAFYYYQKALRTNPGNMYARAGMGELFLFQNKCDTALSIFWEALSNFKENNNRSYETRTLLNIARAYVFKKDDALALKYGMQGLRMAKQTGAKEYILDGYKLLSTVYDRLGNIDSAYHYQQNFISMKDAMMSDEIKGKLFAFKKNAEDEKTQARIAILTRDNQLRQQEMQRQILIRNIVIAALIIVLIVSLLVMRNIKLKRKKEQFKRLMNEANAELENTKKEQELLEQKQEKTETEIQTLRMQMNPHFVFNSLNSINRFILLKNNARASEYLTKFSKLIRLILQNSQASHISLESELEALQLYLELEAVRFDHHFTYKITIDKNVNVSAIKVPPLIIQPYAENAIWHGLLPKEEKGFLEIKVSENNNMLLCRITDNGIGRKKAEEYKSKSALINKSMGLRTTADRIARQQQNKKWIDYITVNDLKYADGSPAGTEVLLKIPVVQ